MFNFSIRRRGNGKCDFSPQVRTRDIRLRIYYITEEHFLHTAFISNKKDTDRKLKFYFECLKKHFFYKIKINLKKIHPGNKFGNSK